MNEANSLLKENQLFLFHIHMILLIYIPSQNLKGFLNILESARIEFFSLLEEETCIIKRDRNIEKRSPNKENNLYNKMNEANSLLKECRLFSDRK